MPSNISEWLRSPRHSRRRARRGSGRDFRHSNVPRHWTEDEVALVRDFAERTQAAIARRRAEQDLRESELRYRTLFDSIDEGFCVIEFLDGPEGPASDYVHVQANPAYTRHAGIPDIVASVSARSSLLVRRMPGPRSTGGADHRRADPFRARMDRDGPASRSRRFRIDPSTRRQVAVLFRDITTRKRAEAALRDLNETLERRVRSGGRGAHAGRGDAAPDAEDRGHRPAHGRRGA